MAYHSKKSSVYHLYKTCHVGNNIEKENFVSGTGGKTLCNVCKTIQEEKKKK